MSLLLYPQNMGSQKWEDDKKPTSQKTCHNLSNSTPAGRRVKNGLGLLKLLSAGSLPFHSIYHRDSFLLLPSS